MRFQVKLLCLLFVCAVCASLLGAVGRVQNKPDDAETAALVAKGKALYAGYKCFDCHGANGEGTSDAPDLVGTLLTADEISAFLQKPSADADAKGMPKIPASSRDLKPLVAFVVSIKRQEPKR
jgi:mono/diheme cytochrome c family protein